MTDDIVFPDGGTAIALRLADEAEVPNIGMLLALPEARPTIALVGGAAGLEKNEQQLHPIFSDALVPLAEELRAYVVDGGTDAGVMRLMGITRLEARATFPLIGVAPEGAVLLPDDRRGETKDVARLESHHTHFVLVPGSRWGAESPWLARVAGALARNQPSVTVLVNGGEVAWEDVTQSLRAARPVFVVRGSGRLADTLADALRGARTVRRASALVATGLVRASDSFDADGLRRDIGHLLAPRS